MTTNPRTGRVQGLRRSNAAGPHGTGRRPTLDPIQAIEEETAEDRAAYIANLQEKAARNLQAHRPTFEPDYGVRFVCSCGEVSPYFTSKDAARMAHAEHVHPGPRAAGTEPLS